MESIFERKRRRDQFEESPTQGPTPTNNNCTTPNNRNQIWLSKHIAMVEAAKSQPRRVVLIGDSIIANIQRSSLWKNNLQHMYCLNFGIGGDRVEHVMFRILNGAVSKEDRIVVLMVGTNNTSSTPRDIYIGILKCIVEIHKITPLCHIILPTLLPRGQYPNELRKQIEQINMMLGLLGKEPISKSMFTEIFLSQFIHVVPIHKDIVDEKGIIPRTFMYDFLHLTDLGYHKCFTPIYCKIRELFHEDLDFLPK